MLRCIQVRRFTLSLCVCVCVCVYVCACVCTFVSDRDIERVDHTVDHVYMYALVVTTLLNWSLINMEDFCCLSMPTDDTHEVGL